MMVRDKATKATKRKRSTKDEVGKRRKDVTAAAFACLTAGGSLGASKLLKREGSSERFPSLFDRGSIVPASVEAVKSALKKCRGAGRPEGGWTAESVDAMLNTPGARSGLQGRLLSGVEEISIAARLKIMNKAKQDTSRPVIRRMVRAELMRRKWNFDDSRREYHNTQLLPLTKEAWAIINGEAAQPLLPSDRWFTSSFYPRMKKHGLAEKSQRTQDIARTATYNEESIRSDMSQCLGALVGAGIMQADSTWVPHATDNPDEGRLPGHFSRAKLIQTDETGEFIYYNTDGKFRRHKAACGIEDEVLKAAIENRETFTVVPWVDGNGTLIFLQLIFVGAKQTETTTCNSLTTAPILVQHTAKGMQTEASLAEAIEALRVQFDLIHAKDGLKGVLPHPPIP
jgi:hypothetical protein